MKITINGQTTEFPAPLSITDALAQKGYAAMTVAVARNGTFIPKSTHAQTLLNDGDEIEIVAPMQGG